MYNKYCIVSVKNDLVQDILYFFTNLNEANQFFKTLQSEFFTFEIRLII